MENEKENKLPKKRGNFIFRQELTNLTPECNAKCAIICNLILMILFFTFGGIIISSSQGIIEISQEYTNCTIDSNQQSSLIFTINNTMINPIFLYYELHNFYMNNRDFVKSRIYPQLRGEIHVVDIIIISRIQQITLNVQEQIILMKFLIMIQKGILIVGELVSRALIMLIPVV